MPKGQKNRWTNFKGGVVVEKYGFNSVLKKLGDQLETYPMSIKDIARIETAAKMWAYRHNCKVSCIRIHTPEGRCSRITVVAVGKVR